MQAGRIRFSVRRLMLMVAGSAVLIHLLIVAFRFADDLRYCTFGYGWNTSVLLRGQTVAPVADVRARDMVIPAGTRCVVGGDCTDEDSAYPDRDVSVEISEGRHKGEIVDIKRSLLRAR
jgi:hypothetical protein